MINKPVSFEADVKVLFSDSQRDCMVEARRFDLHNYDDTKKWCSKIIARLKDGSMPDDDTAPWPADRIAIIEAWQYQEYPA
jgi:hypothetical protein